MANNVIVFWVRLNFKIKQKHLNLHEYVYFLLYLLSENLYNSAIASYTPFFISQRYQKVLGFASRIIFHEELKYTGSIACSLFVCISVHDTVNGQQIINFQHHSILYSGSCVCQKMLSSPNFEGSEVNKFYLFFNGPFVYINVGKMMFG